MALEFDSRKDAVNIEKHGISLARFEDMDFTTALQARSAVRATAGEERWVFVGIIDGKLWTGVVTYRGEAIRMISLRRANRKERRLYGETT